MSVSAVSHHARNRTRLLLRNVVISLLAAVGIVASIWFGGGYIRVFPTFFAPQNILEAMVRDVLQNDRADCVLPNGRRCASGQNAEPDPPYASLEQAARKVMRHAGL